jgi:hypothetical protein
MSRLLIMGACAIVVVWGATSRSQRRVRARLQRADDDDRLALREALANSPPPNLREVAGLSPYPSVQGLLPVREVGGPERAAAEFVEAASGLNVNVSIHTCRPLGMERAAGWSEINLIDGTDEDLCTSGGSIVIGRPGVEEQYLIHFKLLGTPPGAIHWNARAFVIEQPDGRTWEQDLQSLRQAIEPPPGTAPPTTSPATIREIGHNLESYDARRPERRLMHGPRDEMRRLLGFREAFRKFYVKTDERHARQVAWLILESLLDSPQQRTMSDKWRRELADERS